MSQSLPTQTPVRLIETSQGILLVPMTDEPMSAELAAELEAWQSLAAETFALFPYEDEERFGKIEVRR